MRIVFFPIILIALFFLYSCSTDFDINAEKQDITIVYGLLDPSDTVQYIKITKAFLGENSAIEMAQDPSLSSYGDDLIVTIKKYSNGVLQKTYTLEKVWISNKDSGTFYYPLQEVYKFIPNPPLNPKDSCFLRIQNKVTGKITTASTNLIYDFSISQPAYNPDNPQLGLVGMNGGYFTYEAKWKSARNGRIYTPYFRFHYKEINNNNPTDTAYKYIDWILSTQKSEKLTGGEDMVANYNSEDFFRKLQAKIPVDNNVTRFIGKMDFIISVGGDDLSVYMDLNKPSTSIIQERPLYTNVSNGLGIFSCRYSKKYTFTLSAFTQYEIKNGQYTSQLNFHY